MKATNSISPGVNSAVVFQLSNGAIVRIGALAALSLYILRLQKRYFGGHPASMDHQQHTEELNRFVTSNSATLEFTAELQSILEVIAVSGSYWHSWPQLRSLISFRLNQVLNDYKESQAAIDVGPPRPLKSGETFDQLQKRLQDSLHSFERKPPFTLQRLCEILLHPRATYSSLDNVALALEKLLLVTSTINSSKEPYPTLPLPHERLAALSRKQKQRSAGKTHLSETNGVSVPPNEMDVDTPGPSQKQEPSHSMETQASMPPVTAADIGPQSQEVVENLAVAEDEVQQLAAQGNTSLEGSKLASDSKESSDRIEALIEGRNENCMDVDKESS